jgi:hypothetical protein
MILGAFQFILMNALFVDSTRLPFAPVPTISVSIKEQQLHVPFEPAPAFFPVPAPVAASVLRAGPDT